MLYAKFQNEAEQSRCRRTEGKRTANLRRRSKASAKKFLLGCGAPLRLYVFLAARDSISEDCFRESAEAWKKRRRLP
jgi:hypothetical protein